MNNEHCDRCDQLVEKIEQLRTLLDDRTDERDELLTRVDELKAEVAEWAQGFAAAVAERDEFCDALLICRAMLRL